MMVATTVEMFNQINNNFIKILHDLHPKPILIKIAPPFERQTERTRDTAFLHDSIFNR